MSEHISGTVALLRKQVSDLLSIPDSDTTAVLMSWQAVSVCRKILNVRAKIFEKNTY